MKRVLMAALVVALVTGIGSARAASRPSETAGAFITRILREELSGQWSKQWLELHPGHQRLITRAQYVACSRSLATNVGTGREIYRVLSIKSVPIHVLNVPQTTAKLVRISVHISNNETTYELHAVNVSGRWRWIFGGRFLSAVEQRRCLDGSPLKH